jgi:hypothetical protein
MFDDKEEERRLKSDSFEGKLTTKYRYASLGHLAGYECCAIIETEHKKYELTYLCKWINPEVRSIVEFEVRRSLYMTGESKFSMN